MSRLCDLYKAKEDFRELNLPIDEDFIQEANLMEEEIIKKGILPVLTETIEPALQPVKRELVLVVDYIPGQPLSVHLSRKRNFAAGLADAKEIILDPGVEHRSQSSHSDEKIERGAATGLCVSFADGTVSPSFIA